MKWHLPGSGGEGGGGSQESPTWASGCCLLSASRRAEWAGGPGHGDRALLLQASRPTQRQGHPQAPAAVVQVGLGQQLRFLADSARPQLHFSAVANSRSVSCVSAPPQCEPQVGAREAALSPGRHDLPQSCSTRTLPAQPPFQPSQVGSFVVVSNNAPPV